MICQARPCSGSYEPSNNGNTEEIENPKENNKKMDLLYG